MEWSNITLAALQNAWQGTLMFLPKLAIGLIVFGIGWIIASGAGKVVARLLKQINLDGLFQKSGWKPALEKADIRVSPSEFLGAIVKWIFVVIFLQIFADILGLSKFADLLTRVLEWLPNLIVAAAIFVVAIIVADILEKIIKASISRLEVKYANFLGASARVAIYIFATMMILMQLGVGQAIIITLVNGLVGMLALAFGLAFGLGGKDAARDAINSLKNKLSE